MSAKNNLTIAQKLAKLGELTAWFEGDEFVLEEAVGKFKEAEKLAGEIEADLMRLKNEISVIKQRFEGE